jgi:hypothetical protein
MEDGLKIELPRDTLIEAEIVIELRGEVILYNIVNKKDMSVYLLKTYWWQLNLYM